VRRVVVEDAEGEGARLDAALEAAVGAYADPWEEAASPVHPTQFASLLAPATPIEEPIGGR
jgi:nitrite reductase (NADH) large subunit